VAAQTYYCEVNRATNMQREKRLRTKKILEKSMG
jgi:hypothetical protein